MQLTFTPAQLAGIEKARTAYNLEHSKAPLADATAYVQMVMDSAAEGYAKQWSDDTKEGLAAQLAAVSEAKVRAESEAATEKTKADAEKARADALQAEKVEVAK